MPQFVSQFEMLLGQFECCQHVSSAATIAQSPPRFGEKFGVTLWRGEYVVGVVFYASLWVKLTESDW